MSGPVTGTGRDALELDPAEPCRAVLLGGEPLGEELVLWWNVVGRSRRLAAPRALRRHVLQRAGVLPGPA